MPVIGNYECEQKLRRTKLGYDFKLHGGFLCAGGEEGKDACKVRPVRSYQVRSGPVISGQVQSGHIRSGQVIYWSGDLGVRRNASTNAIDSGDATLLSSRFKFFLWRITAGLDYMWPNQAKIQRQIDSRNIKYSGFIVHLRKSSCRQHNKLQ